MLDILTREVLSNMSQDTLNEQQRVREHPQKEQIDLLQARYESLLVARESTSGQERERIDLELRDVGAMLAALLGIEDQKSIESAFRVTPNSTEGGLTPQSSQSRQGNRGIIIESEDYYKNEDELKHSETEHIEFDINRIELPSIVGSIDRDLSLEVEQKSPLPLGVTDTSSSSHITTVQMPSPPSTHDEDNNKVIISSDSNHEVGHTTGALINKTRERVRAQGVQSQIKKFEVMAKNSENTTPSANRTTFPEKTDQAQGVQSRIETFEAIAKNSENTTPSVNRRTFPAGNLQLTLARSIVTMVSDVDNRLKKLYEEEEYLRSTIDEYKGVERVPRETRLEALQEEITQILSVGRIDTNSPDVPVNTAQTSPIPQNDIDTDTIADLRLIADELCEQYYNKLVLGLNQSDNRLIDKAIERYDSQIYIEPEVIDNDAKTQGLAQHIVADFMNQNKVHSLVITADSGTGKTLCSQQITHQLWKKYRSQHHKQKHLVIPIWMSIGTITREHREKKLLETALAHHRLRDTQIASLKRACKQGQCTIIAIIDGWDEIPRVKENLFKINQLWSPHGWLHIKVISTCRPEMAIYYGKEDQVFRTIFQDRNENFQKVVLQPFDNTRIESYLESYCASKANDVPENNPFRDIIAEAENDSEDEEQLINRAIESYLESYCASEEDDIPENNSVSDIIAGAENDSKDEDPLINNLNDADSIDDWSLWTTYRRHLRQIPGLWQLVQTPYILMVVVHVLPEIVAGLRRDPLAEKQRYKVIQVFEKLAEHWHQRQARRLWNNTESKEVLKELGLDNEEQLQSCLNTYSQNLAVLAFNLGRGKFDINSILDDDNTVRPELIASNDGSNIYIRKPLRRHMELIRSGSLLSTENGAFKFRHKSLIVFFASKEISASFKELIAHIYNLPVNEIEGFKNINNFLFYQEPQLICQMAQIVQCNELLKNQLYQLIEDSSKEPLAANAAANAIMILSTAGEDFSNRNFQNIHIPGAILINPVLDNTNFKGANLKGVHLISPWMNNANFTGACMQDLHFMESPSLLHGELITTMAVDPQDNKWILLGDFRGNLVKRDVATGKILWKQRVSEKGLGYRILKYFSPYTALISKLEVSLDGRWAAVVSMNQKHVKLFNIERGEFIKDIELENNLGMMITSVLFSPSGEIILVHCKRIKIMNDMMGLFRGISVARNSNEGLNSMLYMLSIPDGHLLNQVNDVGEKFAISPDGQWLVANYNAGGRDLALVNLGNLEITLLQTDICISNDSPDVDLNQDGQLGFMLGGIQAGESHEINEILSDPYIENKQIQKSRIIFSPNGEWLAIGANGQVRILNTNNWHCEKAFAVNGNLIGFVAKSQLIITGSQGYLSVYHVNSMKNLYDIVTPNSDIIAQLYVISPDDNYPCVYQAERDTVRVWPVIQELPMYIKPQQLPMPISLIAQQGESGICRQDPAIFEIKKEDLFIKAIIKKEMNRLVVHKGRQKEVFLFKGSMILSLPSVSDMVQFTMRLSPDNKSYLILTYTSKPNAPLSEAKQGGRLSRALTSVLFSDHRFIRVWDLKQIKALPTIEPQQLISSMKFSHDDHWLVTAAHTIQIWALQSGCCLYEFGDHKYGVGAVAISPDNKMLASFGYRTNILRIWDMRKNYFWESEQARCLYILENIPVRILDMHFSIDGYLICEMSKGGQLIFNIQENDGKVRLILERCSSELNLMASSAQIDKVVGLSDKNLQLLRQRGAKGTPATKISAEALAKFGLIEAKDAESLPKKSLNFAKPIIRGRTYSVLNSTKLIHYEQWTVSLVRDALSSYPEHAFIVIEGVNALGRYVCMRGELVLGGAQEGPARIKMEEKLKGVSIKDRVGQIKALQALRKPKESIQLNENIEGLFGVSWRVSRKAAMVLRADILADVDKGARPYSVFGSQSFFSPKDADNCYTYLRNRLLALGEPEIQKDFSKWSRYYLPADPRLKLRNPVEAVCP